MSVPTPIKGSCSAQAPQDVEAPIAAFAADTVVHDTGRARQGSEKTQAWWWQAGKEKCPPGAEPLELAQVLHRVFTRAWVSSDLPVRLRS